MELTQKTKPVILISLHEISATHHLVLQNLDALAEKDDELRVIMKDLGDAPPEIPEEDDREIQLTLTSNRFKVEVEEDNEVERLYAETKELIIPVLRTIPIETFALPARPTTCSYLHKYEQSLSLCTLEEKSNVLPRP